MRSASGESFPPQFTNGISNMKLHSGKENWDILSVYLTLDMNYY